METNIEETHNNGPVEETKTNPTKVMRKKPCPKGTRWSRKEQRCIDKSELELRKTRKNNPVTIPDANEIQEEEPPIEEEQKEEEIPKGTKPQRKKPCPKGTRWSRKEQKCIPKDELDARKTRRKKIALNPPVEEVKNDVESEVKETIQKVVQVQQEVSMSIAQPDAQPDAQPEDDTREKKNNLLEKIIPTGIMNMFAKEESKTEESNKEESKTEESNKEESNKEEKSPLEDTTIDDVDSDSDSDSDSDEKDNEIDEEVENDENKEQAQMELQEYKTYKRNPNKDGNLYPDTNDPNFNLKIANKQEFRDHQYQAEIAKDIPAKADEACKSDFEILPHQQFVRNFMSTETPYNSLLLFHELGTGKTCSAIGIAEEMRMFMKQTGISRKIIVMASPNVQDNFRLQLFDPRKLVYENKKWTLNTCIGNALLREINPGEIEGMTKEEITRRIRYLIKKYYIFTGYESIKQKVEDEYRKTLGDLVEDQNSEIFDLKPIKETDSAALVERKENGIKKIRQMFDNRLFIVDEVQNVLAKLDTVNDSSSTKKSAKVLKQIARFCKHTRFILLSATPIYNQPDEIISLVNLMNLNDNRAQISRNQILDKDGNFVPEQKNADNMVIVEGGRELLKRKLIGYVSYVRGENPYTFPFRLYPTQFSESKDNTWASYSYPTKMFNDVDIEIPPKKHVINNTFVSKMGSSQKEIYESLLKEEMPKLENRNRIKFHYLDAFNMLLNMSYPVENMEEEKAHYGTLKKCMKYEREGAADKSRISNFDYYPWVLEKYGRMFAPDKIQQFSGKIHSIIESIQKSEGVVLIYSRYLEGGLLPMALALEELGLRRYSSSSTSRDLLKTPKHKTEPFFVKTKHDKNTESKDIAQYVMITGTARFSPNNKKDLDMVFHENNVEGKYVKVVLISEAGSEGIDFKYLRQIHIMDPWYNMSRIEQIIGRGIRNKSHCMLPFKDRNVEIYMHGTVDTDTNREMTDMYMYRMAEEKAIKIGQITRAMKEVAVDCLLNIEQQKFIEKNMGEPVPIHSSTGKQIQYKIGDKAFSSKCDYMSKCEYKCTPGLSAKQTLENIPVNQSTYGVHHLQRRRENITKRIRQLYREKPFYKREELLREIQIGKPYKLQEIYYVLGIFLKKHEWVIHDNIVGTIIRHGDIYSFQPKHLTDTKGSVYDRTQPIDYKPEHITVNVTLREEKEGERKSAIEIIPRRQKKAAALGRQFKKNNNTQSSLMNLMDETPIKPVQKNKNPLTTIDKYLTELFKKLKTNPGAKNKKQTLESTLYAVQQLWKKDLKLPIRELYYYVCIRHIDTLPFEAKLGCIRQCFQKPKDLDKPIVTSFDEENMSSSIKTIVYSYFRKLMVQVNDVVGIVIHNKGENQMYIWDNKTEWILAKENPIKSSQLEPAVYNRFWVGPQVLAKGIRDIESKREQSNLGYMAYDGKENLYDFKIRDLFISRLGERTGVFCRFKIPTDYLDPFLKELGYSVSYGQPNKTIVPGTKKVVNERSTYCLLYEILLRKSTQDDPTKYSFLGLEEAVYSQIHNLAINKTIRQWSDKTTKRLKNLVER